MIKTIAALFVEELGVYAELSFIDLWSRQRDARKYDGRLPVIAHPPCQLWGNMAAVNFARWGGEHNRPGNDEGCFNSALSSVRKCCGVLEHPAKSRAWAAFDLPHPTGQGWSQGSGNEWVCEVWQSAYGHRANKATWLFYKGGRPPLELEWARPKGSHQIGYPDSRGKSRNKPTLSKREANATPRIFRDALITLALHSVSLSAIVVSTLPLLTPTSTPLDCRNGYCVTRRVSDAEALASDCNPARKDPPSPKAPTPPKDAPPPGGYNPKV